MTRMAGSDCAVMCNLINTHTHTHRYVDKMLEMIAVAGDFVAGAVWHRIIQIVTNHKDLQVQRCNVNSTYCIRYHLCLPPFAYCEF